MAATTKAKTSQNSKNSKTSTSSTNSKNPKSSIPPKKDENLSSPTVSAAMHPLMELFINNLRSMYWAENHLVKSLPKMKNESSSRDLQKAISDHLKITKGHVARIEQAFDILQQNVQATKCDAMEGLTLEGEGVIEDTIPETAVRDLGINLSSQKVETYEITAYQGLISLATTLGLDDVAELFTETLKEEQESLDLLSDMSQSLATSARA